MYLRINETRQTNALRIPHLPFSCLVGTVSNCADALRFETAPTGVESVYLFLEFTIVFALLVNCQRDSILFGNLLNIRVKCRLS